MVSDLQDVQSLPAPELDRGELASAPAGEAAVELIDTDELRTPDYIFKPLDAEFHFTLDAAASAANKKCRYYFGKSMNALAQEWVEYARALGVPPVFWCNPPYSRGHVEAFVRKAYEESRKGATVVLLLPARTEQPWFHEIVLPHAEVRFVRKRVAFEGGPHKNGRFASMVVIFPKRRQARPRYPAPQEAIEDYRDYPLQETPWPVIDRCVP